MNAQVAQHHLAANNLTANVVAHSVLNAPHEAPLGREIKAWAYATAGLAMLAIYNSGVEAPRHK